MRVRVSCKPGETFFGIIFMEVIPKRIRTFIHTDERAHIRF